MNRKGLVRRTVIELDEEVFCELRAKLFNNYLQFVVVENIEDVNSLMLSEKICDCFGATGKILNSLIEQFTTDFEMLLDSRIEKTGENGTGITRARQYYEEACTINTKVASVQQAGKIPIKIFEKTQKKYKFDEVLDYSRIMMCLYMAIMNNNYNGISNFDFSFESIDIDRLITSMKSDNIKGRYVQNSSILITILMYYYMKNTAVKGDY